MKSLGIVQETHAVFRVREITKHLDRLKSTYSMRVLPLSIALTTVLVLYFVVQFLLFQQLFRTI